MINVVDKEETLLHGKATPMNMSHITLLLMIYQQSDSLILLISLMMLISVGKKSMDKWLLLLEYRALMGIQSRIGVK